MPFKPRFVQGNQVRLLRSGDSFFTQLYQLIESAESFIHIHLYILGDDSTGHKVLRLLKEASERGIRVYLLIDQFGSPWLTPARQKELGLDAIFIKRFARRISFKRFTLGRRQHAKLVVVDNKFATISGLNFADRYSGADDEEPWMDYGVLAEGEVVYQINYLAAAYWPSSKKRWLKSQKEYSSPTGNISCKVSWNDWLRNRFQISRSYKRRIEGAHSTILIIAAYFFPSPRMLKLILAKAREGVKVQIVLTKQSDVWFMKGAMIHFYGSLLKSGAEIREWKKSILHAKLLFVDEDWASIGSYNLNQLSDYGSLEANLEIQDRLVSNWKESIYDELLKHSEPVENQNYYLIQRFSHFISFLIIRLSLKFLFLKRTHTDF